MDKHDNSLTEEQLDQALRFDELDLTLDDNEDTSAIPPLRKKKTRDIFTVAGVRKLADEAMHIGAYDVVPMAFLQQAAIDIKDEALAKRLKEEAKQKKLDDKARIEAEETTRKEAEALRQKQLQDEQDWKKSLTASQMAIFVALSQTRHTPIAYSPDNKKTIEMLCGRYTVAPKSRSGKVTLVSADRKLDTSIELEKTKTGTKATYTGNVPFNDLTARRFIEAALIGQDKAVKISLISVTDEQKALLFKAIEDVNKTRDADKQITIPGFDDEMAAFLQNGTMPKQNAGQTRPQNDTAQQSAVQKQTPVFHKDAQINNRIHQNISGMLAHQFKKAGNDKAVENNDIHDFWNNMDADKKKEHVEQAQMYIDFEKGKSAVTNHTTENTAQTVVVTKSEIASSPVAAAFANLTKVPAVQKKAVNDEVRLDAQTLSALEAADLNVETPAKNSIKSPLKSTLG